MKLHKFLMNGSIANVVTYRQTTFSFDSKKYWFEPRVLATVQRQTGGQQQEDGYMTMMT